jgi:hypothetical protein
LADVSRVIRPFDHSRDEPEQRAFPARDKDAERIRVSPAERKKKGFVAGTGHVDDFSRGHPG